MAYDNLQIAKELEATAANESYHGNALYVAQDIPCIIKRTDIRLALGRYLKGSALPTDHIRLQEAAMLLRKSIKEA